MKKYMDDICATKLRVKLQKRQELGELFLNFNLSPVNSVVIRHVIDL